MALSCTLKRNTLKRLAAVRKETSFRKKKKIFHDFMHEVLLASGQQQCPQPPAQQPATTCRSPPPPPPWRTLEGASSSSTVAPPLASFPLRLLLLLALFVGVHVVSKASKQASKAFGSQGGEKNQQPCQISFITG